MPRGVGGGRGCGVLCLQWVAIRLCQEQLVEGGKEN